MKKGLFLYGLNCTTSICDKVIFIDSNLVPAKAFYRNLMTESHMKDYGEQVIAMMTAENQYYTESLKKSLQEDFDFTTLVKTASSKCYGLYGDRGEANYPHRVSDLCLDEETLAKLSLHFIKDACHMPIIENPQQFAETILSIL